MDSGITHGHFFKFRSDLVNWINGKDIESSKHRVGLAQYSDNLEVGFFLNAFKNKQETLDGISGFRLRTQPNKPNNLGKAIEYAHTHYFTHEVGGRAHQGYLQWLVIVTGKKPDDLVSLAIRNIKDAGIKVAAINAGTTMDVIKAIGGVNGFGSLSPDFISTEEQTIISEGKEHPS